jgi:tRNA-dihydrouridine synthase 3
MGDKPTLATLDGGGLKRQPEGEQLDIANRAQSSAELVAATNGAQIEEDSVHEPASKRLKLDQSKQDPRVDARDKVKGVAPIKSE